jgi:hypothetical protein
MRPITSGLAPAEDWQRRTHLAAPESGGAPGQDGLALRAGSWSEPSQKPPSALIANTGQRANEAVVRVAQNVPAEVAFLVHHGMASGVLMTAAATARAQGITADAVLFAQRQISEDHFYRALACHLRLPFVDGRVRLGAATDYPQSVKAGLVPLGGFDRPAFLAAPRGRAIGQLIQALRRTVSDTLAITTPTNLFELVRDAAREEISRRASLGLSLLDPALSAKTGASSRQRLAALESVGAVAVSAVLAPAATATTYGMVMSLAFLAAIWLRLAACMASCRAPAPPLRHILEAELPVYSIVITLYHEARVVPQLIAALDAVDYPASCSMSLLPNAATTPVSCSNRHKNFRAFAPISSAWLRSVR